MANQDLLVEYQSFVLSEETLIRRISEQQKAMRLTSVMSEKSVTLMIGGRAQQFSIAGSFRTEIPSDAISARHRSVLSLIDSFGEYVAKRSEMEPSNLVISARTQADASWMRESVTETLTRLGYTNLTVTTEVNNRTKPMIGWFSTANSNRTIQAPSR